MERLPNWKTQKKHAWKLENKILVKLIEQTGINKFDTTSRRNTE